MSTEDGTHYEQHQHHHHDHKPKDLTKISRRILESQVGGHPGVMTTEDGSLIMKPCLPAEHAFYDQLANNEKLASLRPFVPTMYGTLQQVDVAHPTVAAAGVDTSVLEQAAQLHERRSTTNPNLKDELQQFLETENISSGFVKPAILDIKLGTELYDESASEEKKERKRHDAKLTTSFETGICLTGWQLYDHTLGKQVAVPKAYGKGLKVSELPEGFRRFFPTATSETPSGQGVPADLLSPILEGLAADIQAIRDALGDLEVRMINASLLVVYEADWDAARVALERLRAQQRADASGQSSRADAVHGEDEDEDEDEDECDSDSDGEDESNLYAVKLIDFAHSRLTPGQGRHEGLLLGIDTTLKHIRGRSKELEQSSSS